MNTYLTVLLACLANKKIIPILTSNFDSLIDSYLEDKVGISNSFIGVSLAASLKENLMRLHSTNKLLSAGIGNNTIVDHDLLIRKDKIYWLHRSHQKIHEKLLPIHDSMFFETNPIPAKAALSLMGFISEEYRLPMVKMGEANRNRLIEVLKANKII